MYKLKYYKKQKKWAELFRDHIEKAIIEFKSEKRKVFESKAGKAMIDVLKKHVFRNKLSRALKARETFIRNAFHTAYINKVRKMFFSYSGALKIVSNAFKMARQRIDGRSAWEI